MEVGTVELIVGGLTVAFGPAGAQAMLIRAKLNGHLEKIDETNADVKDIKLFMSEEKDVRVAQHADLDKRVTLLETL